MSVERGVRGSEVAVAELLERLYRSLYRIRRVEEEIIKVYPSDRIKSPVHLSIGQEAVSVGVCEALEPEDVVFGTYRSHALYLAKGGDLNRMIAELYGRATGCAKGKGGSMHLVDCARGVMGTSAVVGSRIPHAVGYAYGVKCQRRSVVVASFFGDGAVEEGVFHESVNFAALKKLPIIFVCENNRYAIYSRQEHRQATRELVGHVQSYGVRAERVENNDVLEIYDRVRAASRAIREDAAGPVFLECATYRWRDHVGVNEDFDLGYRSRSEAEPWIEKDQVRQLADLLHPAVRERIEGRVEDEIRAAFEFAEVSPFPEAVELFTDVFRGR